MQTVREDLIGAPAHSAARVIGVSRPRLQRWAKSGLLVPTSRTGLTYAFEDLVSGRVVRELEDRGVHVRHIATIVEIARRTTAAPLSHLRWAVSANEAFVQFPDESWVGDRRPTQIVMAELLDLEQIRTSTKARLVRSAEDAGQTERQRGRLSSSEVFKGTRIPVATVRRYIDHGFDDDRILLSFPALQEADLQWARKAAAS